MTTLDKIFDVWYGVNLEVVNSEVVERGIPFVSRQAVDNGVVCHVRKIEGITPNPAHTLSIAVSGSVLSTFYHDCEYYSGRDVYIAKPKEPMTREEMLYYAVIIEANKYKYNYGRGANKTFRNIIVPERQELPQYVNTYKAEPTFSETSVINKKFEINTRDWKWFSISDIFDIQLTKGDIKADDVEEGEIPLISSGESNNGVVKYITAAGDGKAETFPANTITLDMFCHANYQDKEYFAVGHGRINVLMPKFRLNRYIGIFLCTLMNREYYRFSYGRAVYSSVAEKMTLKLPVTSSGEPDWKFMEEYIKSLPYSVNLEINEKAKLLNEIETYKHKVAALETQLAAQHHNDIHYHIDHVDTLNLGDNVENKFS